MGGLVAADLSAMRELVKDHADNAAVSDSVVDNFINIAVQRANRLVKVPDIEAVATISVTNGNELVLPSDYLEAIELTVASGGIVYRVERKDIHFVDNVASYRTGIPQWFARKTTNLVLAPTPASVEEASLYYYTEVDSLVDDTDTNWYITSGTTAILYGALKEFKVYVSDEDEGVMYEQQFESALNEIHLTYESQKWSGSTLAVSL